MSGPFSRWAQSQPSSSAASPSLARMSGQARLRIARSQTLAHGKVSDSSYHSIEPEPFVMKFKTLKARFRQINPGEAHAPKPIKIRGFTLAGECESDYLREFNNFKRCGLLLSCQNC